MDFVTQGLATFMLLATSLFGANTAPQSVELGLAELSPAGESGGYAVPASGCSDTSHGPIHDCDSGKPNIVADPPIIRVGESSTVYWDPGGNSGCDLEGDLVAEGSVSAPGQEDVSPTAETVYIIDCWGAGNEDTAVVKVLPRIQET